MSTANLQASNSSSSSAGKSAAHAPVGGRSSRDLEGENTSRSERGAPAIKVGDVPGAVTVVPRPDEVASYALDDILTPMERSVKTYLTGTVGEDLIECLSLMAVERPADPHVWMAQRILERHPAGSNQFLVVKRNVDRAGGRSKEQVAHDIVDQGTAERPKLLAVPDTRPQT